MDNLFKTIDNIAIDIKNRVFDNYHELSDSGDILNYCNKVIIEDFSKLDNIKGVISNKDKELKTINEEGEIIVSYIAIDSLELLELSFSVGSLFGFYKGGLCADNLIGSSYITYGPTFQVMHTKDGRTEFHIYDDYIFKKQPPLSLSNKGKINSTAGDIKDFEDNHKKLIQNLFNSGYRLRLSNSFVLDMHQIIFKKGGLYSNPSMEQELLFELYPFALIIESLGGEAIDGKNRILDIKLEDKLDKKSPIYIGSKDEISLVKEYLNN